VVTTYLKALFQHFPQGNEENSKNFSQDSWPVDCESNMIPSKYEAGMQKHSITFGGSLQKMFNLKLQKPDSISCNCGRCNQDILQLSSNPSQSSTTIGLNIGNYAV
jgi:hypothetical protein